MWNEGNGVVLGYFLGLTSALVYFHWREILNLLEEGYCMGYTRGPSNISP